MKKILLILMLISVELYGQPWMDYVEPGNEENFFEIQKAFERYYNNTPTYRTERKFGIEKRKVPGFKIYKRWEWFWENRINEDGTFPNAEIYFREFEKLKKSKSNNRSSNSSQWQMIGPYTQIPANGGGMGRVNCIAFHPNNPQIIWIGTPAGGIWKSSSGGSSWEYTDTDDLPVLGISDIVFDYQNPLIIYIATGDSPAADTYSLGVMKSTDGGQTWSTTGLSYNFSNSRRIHKLLMHPTNNQILFAATSSGLMRTADGGVTWTLVRTGNIRDIEFKSDNPDVVYCCTGVSVYMSVNGGITFSNTTLSSGFPQSNTISRIALAVTPANPDLIYALLANTENGFLGFYKSVNGGQTWQLQSNSPNLLGWDPSGEDTGGQAFFTLTLAVSPINQNEIYVGGVNIYKSTNGGTTFNLNAHWYGGNNKPYVHADIHDIKYIPNTSENLLIGCDGGVFKTLNGGTSYIDLSAGLAIKQIYRFSNSKNNESKIIMGSQDNGTVLRSGNFYDRVLGGDGMDCIIDHTDENTLFAEFYYGDLYKSTDGGSFFYSIAPSQDGNWVTPYDMAPTNRNILYIGYREIFKSIDNGENWTQVTTGLSNNLRYTGVKISLNPNVVYATTSTRIYKTENAGSDWTNISTGLPALSLGQIGLSPSTSETVVVPYSTFSGSNKVFVSRNGGSSWINITKTGLPAVPVNCAIILPGNKEIIAVGTDLGVFYTDSTMTSWIDFNSGFPNTVVNDLEYHQLSNKLRAATYGRGVWEISMEEIISFTQENLSNNLFDVYPNPASNNIYINSYLSEQKESTIEIIDVTGKIVLRNTIQNKKNEMLNIEQLANGVYFVRMNNSSATMKKIIIYN